MAGENDRRKGGWLVRVSLRKKIYFKKLN